MTTHTPGPWESRNGEVTTRQENGRSYLRIAAVQDYGMGSLPEVDEANANLIAAAPELLAACQDYIDYRGGSDTCVDDIADRMKAAIAKATANPV